MANVGITKKKTGLDTTDYEGQLGGEQPSSNNQNNDYYQLAKDQEYGILFDKEVQLENARANAQKYSQVQAQAQGLGSTGYGSSLQNGIYNNYMNQVNQAQRDYAGAVRDINQQQNEANVAEANDRFQSVTTMLASASDVNQMNQLLSDYGYLQKDAEGNLVLDDEGNAKFLEEKPADMSDEDWYQLKYYYTLQKDALGGVNTQYRTPFTYARDGSYIEYDESGNASIRHLKDGAQNGWNTEADSLAVYIANNEIPNNAVIQLKNAKNKSIYLIYKNGQLYTINPAEYEKGTEKYIFNKNSISRG